jgi:molybdopterin synthase catalytic subunit
MLHLLTYSPLDLAAIYQAVDRPGNGAVVVMSGMVRDRTKGRAVEYLDYQAYKTMALQVFEKIDLQARSLFPDIQTIAIHHRLGILKVGEISILIAVGSSHRGAAFSACEHIIDSIKQDVPIWKKEYWQDGDSSWVTGIEGLKSQNHV